MYQNLIANTMTVQSSKHHMVDSLGWVCHPKTDRWPSQSPKKSRNATQRVVGQRPAFTVGRTQNVEPEQHRAHLGCGMSQQLGE